MAKNYKDRTPGDERRYSAKIWVRDFTEKHREKVAAEKKKRDERLKAQKAACRENVRRLQEKARKEFKDTVIRAREIRKHAIDGARQECHLESDAIAAEEKARLKAIADEKRFIIEQRLNLDRATPRGNAGAYKAAAKRSEGNDRVESDVAAEDLRLVPVWKAWKHKIKGPTPHARFEAFMQAVHDHGGVNGPDVMAIWGEELDKDDLAREQEAHYKAWGEEIERRKHAHHKRIGGVSSTLTPF